jgi:hypothetical protein
MGIGAIWAGVKVAAGAVFGGGYSKTQGELVNDTVRGVGNWIDEQQFTDQEKNQAKMELAVKYAKFVDSTISENSERSKTRRALALWIIRLEGFFLLFSLVLVRIDPDLSKYSYKLATESPWGILTLGVGAFFFATHLLRSK